MRRSRIDRLVLCQDTFFDATGTHGEWDAMRDTCLSRRQAVAATMSDDRIALQSIAGPNGGGTIVLRGAWRVPAFEEALNGPTGARILLPYLLNIVAIVLPHDILATADMSRRPIADVFAEGLLTGLSEGAAVSLHSLDDARRGPHVRKFRRQYHRLLKQRTADPALAEGNALEMADLVLANGFAPVLHFADPLLENGARHLRVLTEPCRSVPPSP